MDPTAKPTAIGPPFNGQIKIITELPPGLDKSKDEPKENEEEEKEEKEDKSIPATPTKKTPSPSLPLPPPSPAAPTAAAVVKTQIKSEAEPILDLNLDLRVNIFEAAAKAYKEKKTLKKCGVCEKDVKEGYEKDSSSQQFICASCYESDKLLENTTKDDYTRSNTPEGERPWTEQEELLLLEGLEMFPSDWDDIAKHVSSRTRDECILHYLKLPTADPRIDEEVKKLGLLRFNQKDNVSNPVMSVVAFLAANVKPQVAASSIDQYKESNEGIATAMESTSDTLDVFYDLIHSKIAQFTSRLENFEQMESAVDEQRRQLEREKFLIREDHLSIRNRMDAIYHIMFQRRQAKLLKEQQQRIMLEEQQQREEPMPLDIVIKLPTEPMTQEERSFQEGLRAKYPTQYIRRQHELAASRQASLPLAPPSIPS